MRSGNPLPTGIPRAATSGQSMRVMPTGNVYVAAVCVPCAVTIEYPVDVLDTCDVAVLRPFASAPTSNALKRLLVMWTGSFGPKPLPDSVSVGVVPYSPWRGLIVRPEAPALTVAETAMRAGFPLDPVPAETTI